MFWHLSPTMNGNSQVGMGFGNLVEMLNQLHLENSLFGKILSHSRVICRGARLPMRNHSMMYVQTKIQTKRYALSIQVGFESPSALIRYRVCSHVILFFSLQPSSSLSKLVRAILLDKKPEEVPNVRNELSVSFHMFS